MKKTLFVLAFIFTQFNIQAQVKTPQLSPKATIFQTVGLTDVEIVYSRPSVRGRTIFGDLVPFGKLWRTGANKNTTISFSTDVVIDGKTLKEGNYALYAIPNIGSWELIFYSKNDNWGTPEELNEADIALRTTVSEEALPQTVETFTMGISKISTDFAFLEMAWEHSSVALKFEVPTEKMAMASIEKVLAGPTDRDYFSSAQYFYQSNTDLAKALVYVNKALEMNADKPFYYYRLKSLIQAKMGDKKGAIATAKLSLAAAEIAKNQDYVKMNKDSIAEWSKK